MVDIPHSLFSPLPYENKQQQKKIEDYKIYKPKKSRAYNFPVNFWEMEKKWKVSDEIKPKQLKHRIVVERKPVGTVTIYLGKFPAGSGLWHDK